MTTFASLITDGRILALIGSAMGCRMRNGSTYFAECAMRLTAQDFCAGTFPNGCETEADWVAAQKRGVTWRQLSDPERQAVSLDAVRHKGEDKNWTRAAAADLLKLKTQLHAALQKEEFRQAAELKKKLESNQ